LAVGGEGVMMRDDFITMKPRERNRILEAIVSQYPIGYDTIEAVYNLLQSYDNTIKALELSVAINCSCITVAKVFKEVGHV
jgi:hypothetical protein